jgi:hypothetical protein
MKKVVILLSLVLHLTAFKSPSIPPKTFTKVKTSKTIALINYDYHYFIKIKLNNRTANLLVDTGAAASLLDINQANDYEFKFYIIQDATFAGAGGLSNRFRVTSYKFDHDDAKLNVYAFGADLKFVVESFKEKGISVVGVIGSDFLKKHDAIIDYKNKQLIIHE